MSSIADPTIPEISWFSALCDDDYEFLGQPNPALTSSWKHCSDIVRTADRNGFDNVLLPSGYTLGIDSTAFAAGIATQTEHINLLLAVRMGEMHLPQLARQLASIDQIAGGRLCINNLRRLIRLPRIVLMRMTARGFNGRSKFIAAAAGR